MKSWKRLEEESQDASLQHAGRYLRYYHGEDGCLVIQSCLPTEQGQAYLSSIDAAREGIDRERKNVPAGTFSVVTSNYETEVLETFSAQRADALSLMAEAFQAGEARTRTGGERTQVVVHVGEKVLKDSGSPGRCEYECECGTAIAAFQVAPPGTFSMPII